MNYPAVYFAINALCLPLLMTNRVQELLRELATEIYDGNPELRSRGKRLEDVVVRVNTSCILMTLIIGTPVFLFTVMDWALEDDIN